MNGWLPLKTTDFSICHPHRWLKNDHSLSSSMKRTTRLLTRDVGMNRSSARFGPQVMIIPSLFSSLRHFWPWTELQRIPTERIAKFNIVTSSVHQIYSFPQYIGESFEKFVDWRQFTAVMQKETVTVMPSCNGGGNVVVALSSSL
jgi:hypothetical protein